MSSQPLSPWRPASAKSLHLDVSGEPGVKAPPCCTNAIPSWGAFLLTKRFFENAAIHKKTPLLVSACGPFHHRSGMGAITLGGVLTLVGDQPCSCCRLLSAGVASGSLGDG